MFRLASRQLARASATRPPASPLARRYFLSTATPPRKSRSLKNTAARLGLAVGGIYLYNTSEVFADEPEETFHQHPQSHHDERLPTIDELAEERKQRLAKADSGSSTSAEELEEEADQEGAFNPETGEINWDCPCLGNMAYGPCGEQFREAFSCFVYSSAEPKGVDCIDKFKNMQECFRQHPDIYGSELDDDDDEDELPEVNNAQSASTPPDDGAIKSIAPDSAIPEVASTANGSAKQGASSASGQAGASATQRTESDERIGDVHPTSQPNTVKVKTKQEPFDGSDTLIPKAQYDAVEGSRRRK